MRLHLHAMNPNAEPEETLPQPGGHRPPSVGELNELIPAYDFLEFLDRGGMGAVYRARQRSLDRIVAVKLLHIGMTNRRAFSDRFKREARALALLNHPHIVSVYDFGEAPGGCLYYVMEYVKGTNLRNLMRGGQTTSRALLSIAMQVCEALQFAHSNGVVHRDVKPANVLIDERGHVKVADFGLAKVIGPSLGEGLTAASDALGTPEYMAPETITHQHEVDHRADIYSLGVMLYEMLTGHVPRGAWEPPSRTLGADARFDEVVSRAMQTDPQKRFQNMGELTLVMKQLVQASGTQTAISLPALERVPVSVDPAATTVALRSRRPGKRFPRLAIVALVGAVAGGIGFSFLREHPAVRRVLGVSPQVPPPAPPASKQDLHAALARFVISKDGFINVTTPFQQKKDIGIYGNIGSLESLPKGEFAVWRVGQDDRHFSDEDLAALIRLCEAAGTVSNLNLHGSGVTAQGMSMLTRLSDTLDSLNLSATEAFSDVSLPFLAACKNLRLLIISDSPPDAPQSEIQARIELIQRFRDALPECEVRLD
jgi:serine/threonine protein kinase